MKSGSDMAQQWLSPMRPWWQLPDVRAGDLLSAGAKQLTEDFAHDPLLKSIEQLWNANPLHDVIPLDWAGIAWALRTVWVRSLSRPGVLPAFAELNTAVWRSALDIWNEAGRRWWGQAGFDPAEAAKGGDKRFAAPEWHGNPLYRTLKEVYLLASDWLLKHREVAERRRTAAAGFPFTPVRRCNEPGAVARVQPGGATAGLRDRGHQPCRRHA